jgi:hypothetical protein
MVEIEKKLKDGYPKLKFFKDGYHNYKSDKRSGLYVKKFSEENINLVVAQLTPFV